MKQVKTFLQKYIIVSIFLLLTSGLLISIYASKTLIKFTKAITEEIEVLNTDADLKINIYANTHKTDDFNKLVKDLESLNHVEKIDRFNVALMNKKNRYNPFYSTPTVSPYPDFTLILDGEENAEKVIVSARKLGNIYRIQRMTDMIKDETLLKRYVLIGLTISVVVGLISILLLFTLIKSIKGGRDNETA